MTTFLQLTYGGVLLAVFAQQLCLPLPSIVFLMAAGALSAHGRMSAGIVVLLGVLGCLAGDGIWFWIGRKWGPNAIRVICRFSGDPRGCSANAREKFRRYGLRVFCVAKFLPGLDLVLPPLAAAEGVSLTGFLAFDTLGALLWSGCYVGLGYVFSNQLDVAMTWAEHFGTVLGIVVGVPLGLYVAWRGLTLVRMVVELRRHRISPPMLAHKLTKSSSRVAVLDLMNLEQETESGNVEAIPGAFSLDPSVLRKAAPIELPKDVKVILYNSSGSDAVTARAAIDLKRMGVDNLWVLDGGLKAWREQGFPVSQSLEAPEVIAERLGVKLPEQ